MPGPRPRIWCSAESLFASPTSKSARQCNCASKKLAKFKICHLRNYTSSILCSMRISIPVSNSPQYLRFMMFPVERLQHKYSAQPQMQSAGSSSYARKRMRTREAILPDAQRIHNLIAAYSGDGTLLPRSLAEICENVRDFVVL